MKTIKKYTIKSFLIILAMLLLFCSCAVQTAEVKPTEIPEEVIEENDELCIAIPENVDGTNPLKVRNSDLINFYSLIYEGLIKINPDGSFKANLAETWNVKNDGKTWVFKIRNGVKWHDGSELTADDVIFSFDVLKTLSTKDSVYRDVFSNISSYKKTGDYEIEVVTKKKTNILLAKLTFPIISKAVCGSAEGANDAKLIGTGPYLVSANQTLLENIDVELIINDSWWRDKPSIQNIIGVRVQDEETETYAYLNGEIDVATISEITSNQYKEKGRTSIVDYTTQYYEFLIPNMNRAFFSDINARMAVNYAINKGDIISKALLGHAVATDVPIPPTSWLYDGKKSIYEYNLSMAQSLMEKTIYNNKNDEGKILVPYSPDGEIFELKLLVLKTDEITYRKELSELIVSQLGLLGITVVVEEKAAKAYNNAIKNGDFDMVLASTYLDSYPNLSVFMEEDGKLNYSGYVNDNVSELIDKCNEAVLEDDIKEAYLVLENEFKQTLPHFPLFFRTHSMLYNNDVESVGNIGELNIYGNIADWRLKEEK